MLVKIFEDFTEGIKEIKNTILLKAVETGDLSIIDTFVKKGYDINGNDDIIEASVYDIDVFRYMLKHKLDIKEGVNIWEVKDKLKSDIEFQKALIDFGYGTFIHDEIGFHYRLKDDPKYADVVDMYTQTSKYNM